jgi:hypothetical protein
MGETAYRVNFFFQLFQSLLSLGMTIAGVAVIFSYTNNLGGWRPEEILAHLPFLCEELFSSLRQFDLDLPVRKPLLDKAASRAAIMDGLRTSAATTAGAKTA